MYHFSSVIGHEAAVMSLVNAIQTQTVGHAYIFEGEAGCGKKTLANAFAKALNCGGGIGNPCSCLSCRVFDGGNHPDVFFIKGTNKNSIGADDVREQIIRSMSVKPFRYKYKVFIIDKAETLTPAAQNTLLKTIEEPAAYGIFLFLAASGQMLLPTVLSRCIIHRLKPLPDDRVREALSGFGITEGDKSICAKFARGSIGKARELAVSEDFAAMRALCGNITDTAAGGDILDIMALYKRMEKFKDYYETLLDILYITYSERDGDKTNAVIRAKRALNQNAHFQTAMEVMLLDLGGYDR
jgi:DNA polymerase-3 subunit delta'